MTYVSISIKTQIQQLEPFQGSPWELTQEPRKGKPKHSHIVPK